MDKNTIKKYAVWARNELIARVTQKAEQYEITEKNMTPDNADSINGRLLTEAEKNQRKNLIYKIQSDGFEQAMEEVAYTWFNRFTALRFMEVNNYLPSHTRVFTNEAGEFKPQILTDAIQLELDGLDMDKVYEYKNANKTEEMFKYLLVTQCNALSSVLPGMFQKIEDYTELLLPDHLLRGGSVIEQMIALIPEEDWTDQVQIIGWLYQYYNTELKDKVFADLKKNIKISKENIPAATQLFTPDWIVRYMVENSLGRLWLEGHPNVVLKSEWKYYLDEAEQEVEVQTQLDAIRKEHTALRPEEIKCIDPCMGSGHILCYLFDVLVQIYEDYGYTAREAAVSIVENNLYGLDIDDRASQLAYFSVMMKARQYDRRFFNKKDENGKLIIPQPHVYAIEESNGITVSSLKNLGSNLTKEEYDKASDQLARLIKEMDNAKEYGSITHITPCDWDLLRSFAMSKHRDGQVHMDIYGDTETSSKLQRMINVAVALTQKYDVVVTNPPYMGSNGMDPYLAEYVKKNFPDGKNDLFACHIENGFQMLKPYGFESMIAMESWMFLSSFEKLRTNLIQSKTIYSLIHMPYLGKGRTSLGINFGTEMSVICNGNISNYVGIYDRIAYYETDEEGVPFEFPLKNEYFKKNVQNKFTMIPGTPVAYWVGDSFLNAFDNKKIYDVADVQEGLKTGDNERFIRFWFEVYFTRTSMMVGKNAKWVYHTKGGDFRKWYGNQLSVLNYEFEGRELRAFLGSSVTGSDNYFKENITYSRITSAKTAFRYTQKGSIPNMAGLALYPNNNLLYILGWLNTKIVYEMLNITNPTINFPPGTIGKLPIVIQENKVNLVETIVKENIELSKNDWDSFEISWDYIVHPLVNNVDNLWGNGKAITISETYDAWVETTGNRYEKLKKNEEELNRIFIDIYGLQDELTPEVEDKDVTVRKADLGRDIRSLISYAVGCMFGRYSLDVPGLVYAGGDFNTKYCRWISQFGDRATDEIDENGYLVHGGWAGSSSWKYDGVRSNGKWIPATFVPDTDNIIPICDDEYFENDVVVRFVKFIETVYGKETLEENLQFIAQALGGKGSSREVIRNYFLNDFYADHLKIYQKRPIYWLFDSGKKNGFKALIYMHRYQPDTIARIRTDYVHELQSRYRTAMADLEQHMSNASTSERVKLNKHLSTLQARAEEIRIYEEKIHHLADQMISIDLDDGVRHNYEIFKDVLAKIK